MKLGDILSGSGSCRPAPTRLASFKVVGYDNAHGRVVADATARLTFVDERSRLDALAEVNADLAKTHKTEPATAARRSDEEIFHVLFRALKDADDPRQPFAESVTALKNALVISVARELWEEYSAFVAEEFPPWIDEEEFKALVEEAKKKSLSDLLSSPSSSQIRRAMPSLVAHFST